MKISTDFKKIWKKIKIWKNKIHGTLWKMSHSYIAPQLPSSSFSLALFNEKWHGKNFWALQVENIMTGESEWESENAVDG